MMQAVVSGGVGQRLIPAPAGLPGRRVHGS